MDTFPSPAAPEANYPSPEPIGRDRVLREVVLSIERVRRGKSAKNVMLIGLHEAVNALLLEQMAKEAKTSGVAIIQIDASEEHSLPAMLLPQLRLVLYELSQKENAKSAAIRGLRALAGFIDKMKIIFNDIDVCSDFESEAGLADNGDLEGDFTMLLEESGKAAQADLTAIAIFINGLQNVPDPQIAALLSAIHRCAQRRLPLVVIGAGLPRLRGHLGEIKSYAERLFDFHEIALLNTSDF
jgi:hypothetical protein